MLFISRRIWTQIRDRFNEDERVRLRKAVRGQVVSPPGFELEVNSLEYSLREKFMGAVLDAMPDTILRG
jgi:hypothetical protein